jgi:hypothetical protein
MAEFKAYAPGVQVNGQTVLAIVDGMGAFKDRAYKILQNNGIVDPIPDKWYNQQAWLDAFKEISTSLGDNTLVMIGKKIPENAKFPPDIDSLGKALSAIDGAYHANHRGGDIGNYKMVRSSENLVKMVCNNPYPCAFDSGLVTAFVAKFKPKGSSRFANVKHDDSESCRKKGADSCTYLITW